MNDYNPYGNSPSGTSSNPNVAPIAAPWERALIEKLAFEALTEQCRRRRWGIFFKSLGFLYILVLGLLLFGLNHGKTIDASTHTALVELQGVIEADGPTNANSINASIRAAFENKQSVGVVIRINSPGGSPVQAGLIHDEIKRLRQKNPQKPIVAVVEDLCASGGYYVAAAASKIVVDKASLVGSIGVLMNGFGFTEAMKKLGVERRLITAGENKAFLDPFTEQNHFHTEFAKQMAADIHQQFIDVVKAGRKDKLKDNPELFSGLVWTGQKSVELGLADALGSLETVARDDFKADAIVDYTEEESFAERFAKKFGVVFGSSMLQGVRSALHTPVQSL